VKRIIEVRAFQEGPHLNALEEDVMSKRWNMWMSAAAIAFAATGSLCPAQEAGSATPAPHIFLDRSAKVVAYQLHRLNNAQLVSLERKADAPRYRPIYDAILTRRGLDKKYRDEAIAALAAMDHLSPVVEILTAIGQIDPEDKSTPRELIAILMAQKPEELKAQTEKIKVMATGAGNDLVRQAAYAALAVADGKPGEVWQLASSRQALRQLIGGIPLINDGQLRAAFFPLVNPLCEKAADHPTQIAAVDAISSIPGHEAEVFKELAGLISSSSGAIRDTAIRSIRRIPIDKWPEDQEEPLANVIVKMVADTPARERTGPAIGQAVQLGNDLAGELPDVKGLAIRKSLRSLAVPIVVIRTIREKMEYDTHYFAVQAGKPVQVTLENADAMPHNLVITTPGAMQDIAVKAGTMPPPADSDAKKAYIPDDPRVLAALSMVQPDGSDTMTFTAPTAPGNYDFVCTFPGHWVRMYGVMIVVPDLEAWEKDPKPPSDPLLHKPYASQKNDAATGS
jgi:azurin